METYIWGLREAIVKSPVDKERCTEKFQGGEAKR
jgi:hypothetical protein